ncbi:MAG: hypothetical protein IJD13_05190 [Oscillospiraceae bacterium]|nr:hypothetical protein [Oscillospiraceae bacterium]
MNRFQKCMSGILCAAMVASFAGCGDTAWTHRSATAEVTSGMYIGFTIEAMQQVGSAEGYDANLAVKDMTLDGVNGLTWVQNTAEELARRYLAIEEKFDEMGLSFTAEEQASLNAYIDSFWAYAGSEYEAEGCGRASFTSIFTNTEKQLKVFDAIYGEGGEQEVPEEELRKIFESDYVKASYVVIPLLSESYTPLTGDDLKKVQEEAEDLYEKVQNGADFEQAKAEYEVRNIEGAEPKAEDTSEYLNNNAGYPEALINDLFAAAPGDVGKTEDTNCIYIWQKQALDDEGFDELRVTILSKFKGDEFISTQTDWADGLKVTLNEAAIKKHHPKNLTIE